jgi:murein DD-endopeptidase MepM/ murein hydrolase activator NlpD
MTWIFSKRAEKVALMAATCFLIGLLFTVPRTVAVESFTAGDMIKSENSANSTVYYFDGVERHAFPNEATFYTWFIDFSTLQTAVEEALAQISLGDNMTIKACTKLVKNFFDPGVYIAQENGSLLLLPTAERAEKLFGEDWSGHITFIPDVFWPNYEVVGAVEEDAYPEGCLVNHLNASEVYAVDSSGVWKWIPDEETFFAMGFQWQFVWTTDLWGLLPGEEDTSPPDEEAESSEEAEETSPPTDQSDVETAPDDSSSSDSTETAPPSDSTESPPSPTTLSGAVITYDQTQWPTDSTFLSSAFGPRLMSSEDNRYDYHRGIDIPGSTGDLVYAVADGEVYSTYVENEPGTPYPSGGTTVVLRHTADVPYAHHGISFSTYYSLYQHLNSFSVSDGQTVRKGEQIGTVGETGDTTFEHLHFEIRVGTSCSREYQVSNSTSSCASTWSDPTDPHVNAFAFLPYANTNTNIAAEVVSMSPLTVRVSLSSDAELDFNRIEVTNGALTKAVDFNLREGTDPNDIDNNNYNGIVVEPDSFTSSIRTYVMTFTFSDLTDYDTIKVTDIWGGGVSISK